MEYSTDTTDPVKSVFRFGFSMAELANFRELAKFYLSEGPDDMSVTLEFANTILNKTA